MVVGYWSCNKPRYVPQLDSQVERMVQLDFQKTSPIILYVDYVIRGLFWNFRQ